MLRPALLRLQNAFLTWQFGKLESIPLVHLHVVREQARHPGRRKAPDARLKQSRCIAPDPADTKLGKRSHKRRLILSPDNLQGDCLKLSRLPRWGLKSPIVRFAIAFPNRRKLEKIPGRNHLASAE